jgi:hypothetical protein
MGIAAGGVRNPGRPRRRHAQLRDGRRALHGPVRPPRRNTRQDRRPGAHQRTGEPEGDLPRQADLDRRRDEVDARLRPPSATP